MGPYYYFSFCLMRPSSIASITFPQFIKSPVLLLSLPLGLMHHYHMHTFSSTFCYLFFFFFFFPSYSPGKTSPLVEHNSQLSSLLYWSGCLLPVNITHNDGHHFKFLKLIFNHTMFLMMMMMPFLTF